MIIIAGGELVLCYMHVWHGAAWHAKQEGGVYVCPYTYVLRVNVSLVQNAVCTCCKKGLV